MELEPIDLTGAALTPDRTSLDPLKATQARIACDPIGRRDAVPQWSTLKLIQPCEAGGGAWRRNPRLVITHLSRHGLAPILIDLLIIDARLRNATDLFPALDNQRSPTTESKE